MTQKTIIFDFDGTIADTFSVLLNIYNEAAHKFNCRQVANKDIEKLRSQRPQEFLKDYGVSVFKIPLMVLYIKRRLAKHILEIQVVDGMPEEISRLKQKGIRLGILTSNSKENVEKFLAQNDLLENFEFIYTTKNIFRKDKSLNKAIKKQKLNINDVFYVGDETRDIEACNRVGIKIIAVSWGFNSLAVLKKVGPWRLITHPKDLGRLF